jgi:hypothetical protein
MTRCCGFVPACGATARSMEAGSRRSPTTGSTSNSRILLEARTSALTRCPRSARSRATCQPRKPEAPVTSVGFINRGAGLQSCGRRPRGPVRAQICLLPMREERVLEDPRRPGGLPHKLLQHSQ